MRVLLFAAGVAAFVPNFVWAQSAPDASENVVVTATRLPTEAEEVAAGVTVIDRQTIEDRGYTSLVDALSAVPGLRVVQSGGPGSVASVFIRGTNSNQVLVLRDGVPVNDPGDPGGLFNFGPDTLQDVERIEIVRGPLSSLYGSGAIGGVINLITRHGSGAVHGHVLAAGGPPRQGLLQGDVAGGFGIWDYAASAEGQSIRGFDQTPQRQIPLYTGEVDGDRSKLAQLEIGATPITGTRVSLLLRARDAKYGYDDQGYVSTFDGGNATGYDSTLFGRLGATSSLFSGAWDTSLYLTRLQNDRRYTVTLDPLDPNQDEGDSRYHGRRSDAQWNNTIHLPDYGIAHNTALTLGYEHASDDSDTKVRTISSGFAYDSTVRAHADSDSGSAGLQTTLLGRLNATGQVREDATTIAGDAFTWRVGGVLDLPEAASHIKASYGTSFRAPALFDRYGIDSLGYVGNPDLRPERAQGWEAGVTTDIAVSGRKDAASVSVTYFDNRIRDLIQIQYAPDFLSSTSVNIANARTHGIEAAITLRASSWLQADLAYSYTDARDLDTGAHLLRRPENQGSANLRLVPFPGFVVAPELLYIGQAEDVLYDDSGLYLGQGLSRSGLILNFNLSWQVTQAVQVFAWAKNIGGSTFEPANGYQIAGTSLLAGIRLGF